MSIKKSVLLVIGVFLSAPLLSYDADSEFLSIEKSLQQIKEDNQTDTLAKLTALLEQHPSNPQARLAILFDIESYYRSQQDFVKAINTLKKTLPLIHENKKNVNRNNDLLNDPLLYANVYKRLGIYHYLQGNYRQSIEFYTTSFDAIKSPSEIIFRANLYNNIGLAQVALGDHVQAINNYQKAEELYQVEGTDIDKIDIRFNIAGLYLRLDRYDMAIELFQDVIKRRQEINDNEGVSAAYSDLGIAYKQSGKPELALDYLNKALAYYATSYDLYNLASIYHNLSEVYFELNQINHVKDFARKSIVISEKNDYKTALSGALYSYAKAHYHTGNINVALTHLKRSHDIAVSVNYAKQIETNLSLFSLLYAAQSMPVKALEAHKSYIATSKKRENENLNSLLVDYESQQLKQQVERLKQNEVLQELNLVQAQQVRNFSIIAFFLVSLVVFFVYRRNIERQSKLSLVSQVKSRTSELELLAEKLQDANKIKSLFLANMSHEIRTPLTAIIAQSESLLFGQRKPETLQEDVAIIHNNSLHLLSLINNILDLSKIEANKLELDLEQQDLHKMLQSVANMFAEQAHKKGLHFEVSHQLPVPLLLEIDSFRIKQILINLCSNAVKFTAKGHVKLNVYFENEQLIFSVEDTGIGLSSSQINQVFESFTQGDSSISRRFGGTGLGLCLSEQLAKLMGGKVELTSTLNVGSVFYFILPCENIVIQSSIAKASEVTTLVTEKISEKPQQKLSGTILLAEDHDDNRMLISRLLSSLGLDVITAENGKEAVKQFSQYQPDVVLLDIQMPEMDGLEAHSIMRQQGATQPIIALTANAMAHEVEEYLSQGFDGHLKKPIERSHFIEKISQFYSDDYSISQAEETFKKVDMTDLIEQFKSNLALEQQDIVLHLKNADHDALKQLVHRIAGAAQMFGFHELTQKSIQLEKAINNNESQTIPELTQLLLNEIDQVLW